VWLWRTEFGLDGMSSGSWFHEGKLHVRYSIGGALVAAVINKLVRVAARWMCMVVVRCRSLFNAANS